MSLLFIILVSLPLAAAGEQQTWCIAKPSTPIDQLNKIMNYVCTETVVDCSVIRPPRACYNPTNGLYNTAVVMNMYYSTYGKQLLNCYFDGYGTIVYNYPFANNCFYPAGTDMQTTPKIHAEEDEQGAWISSAKKDSE